MSRGAIAYGHAHAEAFMLMTYRGEKTGATEVIWNSRDGVTPFAITSKDGTESMTHVDWGGDVYAPDFQPPLGSRMFVDLTEDRARALAQRRAEHYWETYPPSRDQFPDVEALAAMLTREYLKDTEKGAPDLIVVAG